MVVSLGEVSRHRLISSNPITEISSGTFFPACFKPDIIPAASISAVAKTAVISFLRARLLPRAMVVSISNSCSNTRSCLKGMEASFKASLYP